MKSKWIVIVTVLAMAGVVMADDKPAASGDAPKQQGPGGPGARRRGNPLEGILAKLNLSDDQKAKVGDIMKAHKDAMDKYREEHKTEFEAVRAKMKEAREAKDQDKMKEAYAEMRKLMEAGPSLKDLADKIREVLTDEQKKTFDEAVAEMKKRFENGGGPGGPRPGGEKKPD